MAYKSSQSALKTWKALIPVGDAGEWKVVCTAIIDRKFKDEDEAQQAVKGIFVHKLRASRSKHADVFEQSGRAEIWVKRSPKADRTRLTHVLQVMVSKETAEQVESISSRIGVSAWLRKLITDELSGHGRTPILPSRSGRRYPDGGGAA